MSFPSHDASESNPTAVSQPMLTGRSASNFYVTPMSGGRPGKMVERTHEAEAEPVAGMGLSIMGSIIGGALGLGPMFEIAFEAMKTGLEISEGQGASSQIAMDVNLNPAALIRPDLAFNFRRLPTAKPEEEAAAEIEARAAKRSWNSGEGDYLTAQQQARRRGRSSGYSPVPQLKGFGAALAKR